MKQNKLLSCLLAAGFSLCMASAHAGGVGYVTSIKDLTVGVVDLTPADGIAAGYMSELMGGVYQAEIRGPGSAVQQTTKYDPPPGPVNLALNNGPSSAAVAFTGPMGDITVQGEVMQNLGLNGSTGASASQTYAITLTAHSMLTLTGNAYIDVAALGTSSPQFGYGSVLLDLWSSDSDLRDTWAMENYSMTKAEQISLDYANPSDRDITIYLQVTSSGGGIITSVPEPSTYAMLLAGLGVAGAAVRRRRA